MDDKNNLDEINRIFTGNGMMLTTHALDFVREHNLDPKAVVDAAKNARVWFVTDEFLFEFVDKNRKEKEQEEKPVVEMPDKKIFAKDIESKLKFHTEYDITKKSTCEGTARNFHQYFQDRYASISKILRSRPSLASAADIKRAKSSEGEVCIIGMVSSKRERAGFNKFFEIEDMTGSMTCMVGDRGSRELSEMYARLLLDEVVGLRGSVSPSSDLFIVKEIIQPEVQMNKDFPCAEDEVYVAFMSDVHVGSMFFLEKEFRAFVDWLNLRGSSNRREIAEKIKYIIVAGDLVDGVGVYPGQENHLSIPDIYKQYDYLAKLFSGIPDYIEVIMGVGNHDAVRLAEPQPALDKTVGGPLFDLPNVHLVGNPALVETDGVKTLVYHGASMDNLIRSIENLSYVEPENAMEEYLKRRHLSTIYEDIAPEEMDYLVIREVPDILHSGHVHANGYSRYRGVHIINSGTWQGQTDYQQKLGHVPTPARIPVMNLKNQEVNMLDFN